MSMHSGSKPTPSESKTETVRIFLKFTMKQQKTPTVTHKASQMNLDGRLGSLRITSTDPMMYSSKMNSFSEFGLPESIFNAIVHIKRYERPSKIQGAAIPRIMDRKSLIGQSQAGSGKTTAFTVGMLLAVDVNLPEVQAICVTPTREICNQIVDDAIIPLATFMPGLRIRLALKGENLESRHIQIPPGLSNENPATRALAQPITAGEIQAKQEEKSGRRPRNSRVVIHDHIVVGTPGKLNEWIEAGNIPLANVKILVLDEADQMIRDFKDEVLRLSSRLPDQCQKLLFSATFSDELKQDATRLVETGDKIFVPNREELILDVVTQIYIDVSKRRPSSSSSRYIDNRLTVLQDIFALLTINQSIVFCETIPAVEAVAERMNANNFSVSQFHGRLEVGDRDASMKRFKDSQTKVLITSNVLARGVDVPDVTCVVNYDLPLCHDTHLPDYETYLHRVGRTGRFGKTGVAISFVTSAADLAVLRQIEAYYELEAGFIREWDANSIDELEELMKHKRHDVATNDDNDDNK